MIVLSSMEKQFGAKILYNKVSGAFNPAYRYGLIGPNGAGKTMLMRVIMGQEHLDKGEVMVPGNMRLGYLPQECDFNDNVTPLNLALKPFEKHLNAAHALEKIDTITDENARAKIIDEYHRLQDELMAHGGFAIEAQAKSIMAGLGIPQASWEHDIRALSGGFRMRVLLTQLLLINPDFLMLDEPTNHLDYDSLVWLEKFLTRFKGGMLIISHDRDFLERVSTHTADLGGGMLNLFTGTVNKYLIWKQEQDELNERRTRSLQQQIDKTEEFIDRFKSKNTKATQAKSKEKHLEKLIADLPLQGYVAQTVRFSIPPATPCGSTPFTLQNTYVGYGADPVLCNLSITISRGNKVAIIGPNGAGKSTLLKTCAGLLVPQMGSLTVGHNAAIRYYSQHRLDQLSPDATLFDTISNIIGTRELTRIQSLLGAFLFSGDDVYKTVGVLSGGEKSRLSLASILAHPGNVLLLDEPTNHLDLASVKRLGDALAEYDGTVLIVSHDEYFVSQFVNRVIEVRPGVVRDFPGGLHDYRGAIEAGFITSLDEKGTDPLEKVDIDKEDRIRRRKERTQLARKIEKAEQSVLKLETDLAIAQKKLDNPENVSNFAALGEIQVLVSTLAAQLETNMNDWAELQEMFAAIDNGAE